MEINTVDNIALENSMEGESTSGQMDHATKDNSTRESVTVRAVGDRLVPILTSTSAPTKKTKRQATVDTSGPTAVCTKADSPTISSTF